jgi:hypothetical protein
MMKRLLISLLTTMLLSPLLLRAQDLRFGGQIPPEVDVVYERGLAWLASKQANDGSFPDGRRW